MRRRGNGTASPMSDTVDTAALTTDGSPSISTTPLILTQLQGIEEICQLQQLLTAPAGLCQNDVSAWVAPAVFRFAMAGATHAETSFWHKPAGAVRSCCNNEFPARSIAEICQYSISISKKIIGCCLRNGKEQQSRERRKWQNNAQN